MKRIAMLMGFVAVLTLGSCKKSWTCQCTDNNGTNVYHDIPDATLSDANRTCNGFEYHNGTLYNNCSVIH